MAVADVTKFEIEEGIEMPMVDTVQARYPFGDLEVGQSFFVANTTTKKMSAANRHWRGKFPDRKWTMKQVSKTIDGAEVEGTRIWRTE